VRKTCRKCRAPLRDTCDSCNTKILEAKITEDRISCAVKASGEFMTFLVSEVVAQLNGGPNYSETLFYAPGVDPELFEMQLEEKYKEGGPWPPERYVLTIQRAGKVTPHQARERAEARVRELEAELDRLRGEA